MYIKDNPEVPVVDYSVLYSGNSKNYSLQFPGIIMKKIMRSLKKA